jgi:hypothetical protein
MATAQDEFNALFNKSSYSTGKSHPEDATEATSDASRSPSPAQSFLNIDDDDEDNEAADLAVKAMRGTYYIPRATRQANTGPKGVIADAQAFEQARRQAQSIASVATKSKAARTSGFMNGIRGSPPSAYKSEEYDKSSEEDIDDDDDEFMATWRERRLLELSNRQMRNVLGRSGKKVYGDLKKVDAEGFLNAVEGAPSDTVVIVLIHDHTVCHSLDIPAAHKLLANIPAVGDIESSRASSPRDG